VGAADPPDEALVVEHRVGPGAAGDDQDVGVGQVLEGRFGVQV
jgi:hypothetical protein